MKRFLSYVFLLVVLSMSSQSCDDVLNIDPGDRFSPATVWEDADALDQYVIGFYGTLKESAEIYNSNMTEFSDAYSDLIKSSSWDQYNHPYNKVLLQENAFNSDGAGVFECWGYCYGKIMRLNQFLRDAPIYGTHYDADFINYRMAEVRFMRAFCYYKLIRVYGGVVPRYAVDGPEENDRPRETEEQSWNRVIEDVTFAAQNLPEKWSDDGKGRLTKAAAYGMMSRYALYAKKWQLAVDAADSCHKYGGTLSQNYADIFSKSDNAENLIAVEFLPGYSATGLSHNADAFFRPVGDSPAHNNQTMYSALTPTSELADAYEMSDGTDFSWTTHGADPYSGREPRFYATILYNNAQWEGRQIQTYAGGTDATRPFVTSGAAGSTTTGYFLKKWITEGDHQWDTKGSYHFYILLRYAEVLLNKAEGQAEAGDLGGAVATLNQVRSRVGLPGISASSKEEFMEHLRHERVVELAGEGFRYWDLRRWRLAEQVINGQNAHGVEVTKSGDDAFTYRQIDVDAGLKRYFFTRYYYFSIPVSERSNNAALGENNPEW